MENSAVFDCRYLELLVGKDVTRHTWWCFRNITSWM